MPSMCEASPGFGFHVSSESIAAGMCEAAVGVDEADTQAPVNQTVSA